MGPVRVGNAAYNQRQNDVYGSIVLALTQLFFDQRITNLGDFDLFCDLELLGHKAYLVWNEEDAGLWEDREKNSVHTYSALLCWAACDRLSLIAQSLSLPSTSQ